MNRANLRELCHKRQKILRYLKKKDKGGARYRNVMEALGLDDAAIERQLYM
jgi:ribosomal protein S15P/S13E